MILFDIFTREGLISFLYTLPALIISLSIHEFAHAFTAYKLGDKSQKAFGRLTLDPFRHIDWMGFLCIALFGFGWGKPVMVDDRNFKKRARDNMLVAFAGPLSNLLVAILLTLILKVLVITGVIIPILSTNVSNIFLNMLMLTIQFNVVFSVFNMIPLPPFDGSKVLRFFLPTNLKRKFDVLEIYSFYIIVIFFVTNAGVFIITPIVNFIEKLLFMII